MVNSGMDSAFSLVALTTQLFLAGTLFFGPPEAHRRTLSALFACLALTSMVDLLDQTGLAPRYPVLYVGLITSLWCLGPLMWFYVKSMLSESRPGMGHFVPAVLWLTIGLGLSFLVPPSELTDKTSGVDPVSLLILTQGLAYSVAILRRIYQTRNRWREVTANPQRHELIWMMSMLALLICQEGLWMTSALAGGLPWTDLVSSALSIGLTLGLGWFGTHRVPLPTPNPAYAKSGMTPDDEQEVARRLVARFVNAKGYKDPTVSLAQVAQTVGCRPQWVSQYLNQRLGQSFFEYVSGLRLQEAKQLIETARSTRPTVLEVALASGFSSVSTFYDAVKRTTGHTPKQWFASLRDSSGTFGSGT